MGTVSYDYFMAEYNNGHRPNGGNGTLDLDTGVFRAETPGHFTVTVSAYAIPDPGQYIYMYLYVNGVQVKESYWHTGTSSSATTYTEDQGSRTVVSSQCYVSTLDTPLPDAPLAAR